MTENKLQQAVKEIKEHRDDIIAKLVQFSKTDSLLFWDKDTQVAEQQEILWSPILKWANQELNSKYTATKELKVPEVKDDSLRNLQRFIEKMDDKELAAFYLASLNMKSELLAAALIKGRINAEQAYNAAYLEEIVQAERWGKDKPAENIRQQMKKELVDIEKFLS